MKCLILIVLLFSSFAYAQSKETGRSAQTPLTAQTQNLLDLLPPVSDAPIYVAYPPDGHKVAFDHVLLEGSVKAGAKLTINGQPVDVGLDGLFIEWWPLKPGQNVLKMQSILAGATHLLDLRVESNIPAPISGKAEIVASSVLPTQDRIAYVQPSQLEMRAVQLGFTGTQGGKAAAQVGDLGLFPLVEVSAGKYQTSFMLPEKLAAEPVLYTLKAADGTTVTATSQGKISVTNSGPRVAEVSVEIAGRGIQAATHVWRNGKRKNFIVYPRTGAQAIVVGEEGNTYVAQLSGSLTMNVPKKSLSFKPAGTPLPKSVFTNIDVKKGKTHTEIHLNTPTKVPFTVEQQVNQDSSSLDLRLYHSVADVDYIVSDFPDDTVRDVRWVHEADGVARVHIDLKGSPWGYDATYNDKNALVLRVRNAPKLDLRYPLKGRTIVLDAGHGGDQFGGAGALRVPEKNLVLPITLRVGQLLKQKGAKIVQTRTKDVVVPIYDRPLLAETSNADMILSIHANALPDGVDPKTQRGAATYFYQPQSRALANSILSSLLKQMPDVGNDGIHYQNLALARPTTQLSVLIEMAFLTDKENLRLMMSETGRERFAQAIALGVERFYRQEALQQHSKLKRGF